MAKKEQKTAEELEKLITEKEKDYKALERKIHNLKKNIGLVDLTTELKRLYRSIEELEVEFEEIEEESEEQELIKQLLGDEKTLKGQWLKALNDDDYDYVYVYKQTNGEYDFIAFALDVVDTDCPQVYKENGQLIVGSKGQVVVAIDYNSAEMEYFIEHEYKIISPLEIMVLIFAPETLLTTARSLRNTGSDQLIIANNTLHKVVGNVQLD